LLTREADRALKAVSNEMIVQGYRLKVFDAYRPVAAVKQFILCSIEDTDVRMKPYFYLIHAVGLAGSAVEFRRQADIFALAPVTGDIACERIRPNAEHPPFSISKNSAEYRAPAVLPERRSQTRFVQSFIFPQKDPLAAAF